jgi:hypothetical protein
MSSKYQVGDERFTHFITFTVVNWIDVFTRNKYRDIVIDSLNYCVNHKVLRVHAFCPDSYRDDKSRTLNCECKTKSKNHIHGT